MAPVRRLLSKAERLMIFRERLLAAPPVRTLKNARALLDATLNKVEDEFSGVPYNLQASDYDGRMYPPLDDNRKVISVKPKVDRFRSAGHDTFMGGNGAIKIVLRSDESTFLDKSGKDGRTIDEL